MLWYFWPRMLATCFGWFANDFGFYGGKVFIGDIVGVAAGPKAGVQTIYLWILLQTGVQLVRVT